MMTRVDVFENIFLVFLGLGTLVGIIVITYTLYNAYKYRDDGDRHADEDLPTLGELPTGGAGGKKLFLSFILSAIIVVSLVLWTYGMLLYVEEGPDGNPGDDALEVDVEGFAFGWNFYYDDGVESGGEMVIPAGETVWIETTSIDVWHSFGISELRVKADAIPGEYDETWFVAEEEGDYLIECFELCGAGHSAMEADLTVKSQEDYEQWNEDQRTLTVTFEDGDGEEISEPDAFEGTLDRDGDTVHSVTEGDVDDGALELTVDEGDTYELTIESPDGAFETVELETDIVDGPEEVVTLESEDDDDDDAEDTDDNDDEEGDN